MGILRLAIINYQFNISDSPSYIWITTPGNRESKVFQEIWNQVEKQRESMLSKYNTRASTKSCTTRESLISSRGELNLRSMAILKRSNPSY